MQGLRHESLAALVGHSDPDGVGPEQLRGRAHESLERRLEREALREGPRDLVEGSQRSRRLLLGLERFASFGIAPLQLLVESCVLDGDRELRSERGHERELVRRQRSPARRVDGEQSDEVLPHAERQPDGGLDPGFGELFSDRSEP